MVNSRGGRGETIVKFKARTLTAKQKTKRLEHLKIHNTTKEQRDKSRERLLEYNKSKGQIVEVLDRLNNETTVYPSIREAAQAIGSQRKLNNLKENGETRLIKKTKRNSYRFEGRRP